MVEPNPEKLGNSEVTRIEIVSVPVLDTGIGRQAGFESDADLIGQHERGQAALSAHQREMLRRIDADITRRFLEGP